MVYLGDVTFGALIVYNHKTRASWRIANKYFTANPAFGKFLIAQESFDLLDGILGLAVSPRSLDYYTRRLYFQSLSADALNSVPLYKIDNPALWTSNTSELQSFVVMYRKIFKNENN